MKINFSLRKSSHYSVNSFEDNGKNFVYLKKMEIKELPAALEDQPEKYFPIYVT